MSNDIKLYSLFPIDRSARVAWMLRELDQSFEQIWLDGKNKAHKATPYTEVNPFARVPTLEFNGIVMRESGAILAELAERFPDANLMPARGSAEHRAFWQWLFWGATTLETAAFDLVTAMRQKAAQKELEKAAEKLDAQLAPLNEHLRDHEYLTGENFTAADIMTGYNLAMLRRYYPLDRYASITAYLDRLKIRPAAGGFFADVERIPTAA